jgi:ABC-type phosphate transport system substrate-binding protein
MIAAYRTQTCFSEGQRGSCCQWNRRQVVSILSSSLAVSSTIKTAIGAGGKHVHRSIMNNWITIYQQIHPSTLVNYRPIGSGAGLEEFKKTFLGFAASDAPLSDEDLRQLFPVIQIPVTAGPVCAIYNVPGVTTHRFVSYPVPSGIFVTEKRRPRGRRYSFGTSYRS